MLSIELHHAALSEISGGRKYLPYSPSSLWSFVHQHTRPASFATHNVIGVATAALRKPRCAWVYFVQMLGLPKVQLYSYFSQMLDLSMVKLYGCFLQ